MPTEVRVARRRRNRGRLRYSTPSATTSDRAQTPRTELRRKDSGYSGCVTRQQVLQRHTVEQQPARSLVGLLNRAYLNQRYRDAERKQFTSKLLHHQFKIRSGLTRIGAGPARRPSLLPLDVQPPPLLEHPHGRLQSYPSRILAVLGQKNTPGQRHCRPDISFSRSPLFTCWIKVSRSSNASASSE